MAEATRWAVVRTARGLPGPVRDIPAAAARGTRIGGPDPRQAQQQRPSDL